MQAIYYAWEERPFWDLEMWNVLKEESWVLDVSEMPHRYVYYVYTV